MGSTHTSCAAILACAALTTPVLAGPFATSVLSYDAGSNAVAGYADPLTALGSAERFTGEGIFPSGITPFNPAFGSDELVSIGSDGHLTLGFDQQITNDASHAHGVDFIVFSNAGFLDTSYADTNPDNDGDGLVGTNPSLFGAGGEATIQVSQNGIDWFTASITTLDLFPTLGYSDYSTTTPTDLGSIESDFTKAMDPTLGADALADMSFAQLIAFYNGSGGGIGIDIASTGLESAGFVRFLNESGEAFEIDAVAVVPAPGVLFMLGLGGVFATPRRR